MQEQKYYGLTHAQKRIWYGEKTYLNTAVSNIANTIRFRGVDDPDVLESAVDLLLQKNDGFRLQFTEIDEDGTPRTVQYVAPHERRPLQRVHFEGADCESQLTRWADERVTVPLDINDKPLAEFAILTTSEGAAVLFVKLHHLISDGGSFSLLAREVYGYYNDMKSRADKEYPKKPSYIEYVFDEKDYLESPQFQKDRDYWVESLRTQPPEMDIVPFASRTEAIQSRRLTLMVPPELRARIHGYVRENKSSVFKMFLSAVGIYLARVNRTDEAVIETVSANRTTPSQREMIGMFVSTILLRLETEGQASFRTIVEKTGSHLNFVLKNHQKYPWDLLNNDVRAAANYSPAALTNVMVTGHPDVYDPNIDMEYHFRRNELVPLIIRVNYNGRDVKGTLEISFDYNVALFSEEEIRTLFSRLLTILDDGISNPGKPLSKLEILTPAEKSKLLAEFNQTQLDYPQDVTIHEMFERMAEAFPEKTALAFQDVRLTYRQLNEKANQLARVLQSRGTGVETVAGIMAARSWHTVVGLLAILKAGGTYAPLDYSYPNDRIRYMLGDAGAKILLHAGKLPEGLGFDGAVLDLTREDLYRGNGENLGKTSGSRDLAYVIYTSGSTGQPKGVMIEHRSVINLFYWDLKATGICSDDVCAEFSAFTFDPSVYSTFNPLMAGAELHILDDDCRKSIDACNKYFEDNRVTWSFMPTQFGESFNEFADNHSLRVLVVAGDRLNKFTPRGYRYVNAYGPTEYTIYTTGCDVDGKYPRIPIGFPVSNSRIYIVDKYDNIQPVGFAGELLVAGDGIARGYLNKPDKTAEKFVRSPFSDEMMYRTGDLCRWWPDGNIDFIGRIDFQVKIRGFRIELSEIEGQLLKHKAIRETVVVARTDRTGNKYLCGYFVSDREIPVHELKDFIKKDLPEYMVPAVLMRLPQMPLNTSGKIDRRSLPEPVLAEEARAVVPAKTEAEIEILGMFQKLFDVREIGILHDFFELGGHSLKAAVLQANIRRRFGTLVSLQDIFKNPTVRDLAKLVPKGTSGVAEEGPAFTVTGEQEHYPLSAAQKRLYVISQMEPDSVNYNIPIGFLIEGNLDEERLASALDQVFARHDVLRTSFRVVDGELRQVVEKDVRLKKLSVTADPAQNPEEVIRDLVKPFDLARGPLFRVQLVKLSNGRHLLLLDFHHIIMDGYSVSALAAEIWSLYAGQSLPPVRHQYRDYVAWQEALGRQGVLEKQEKFWTGLFAGDPPQPLELPSDRSRKSTMDFKGSRVYFSLDPDTTQRLRDVTTENRATLFMSLLTAFSALLCRYCAQEDVVVGVPSAGRTHPEMEKMAGMFVNTLPLRLNPAGTKTFRQHLQDVRNVVLAANDNQDYQLDTLIEKLNIPRVPGRNPLFDVMFSFESGMLDDTRIADVSISPVRYDIGVAKFDLTLSAYEKGSALTFDIEYRTGLFDESTIQRFAEHYLNLVRDAVRSQEKAISHLKLLSEAETRKLLHEFNDNALDVPSHVTLNELFEESVRRFPERTALVYEGTKFTFEQLNGMANRLARVLTEKGLGPERVVAIVGERTWEPVLAMLAALKAGGGYTTIDPSYPGERISYMLADTGACALLCAGRRPENLTYGGEVLDLKDPLLYTEGDSSNLPVSNHASNVAYIIYTSGSTGQPKGVVIEHRSVVNLLFWDRACISQITENDRVAEYPSFAFDASVRSIWQALTAGAELHIISEERRLSVERLNQYFEENRITLVDLPTQFCEIFNELVDNQSLRIVTTGSDRLTRFVNRGYRLVNEYGPTEYTVTTTGCFVDNRFERFPIGKPISNSRVFVLDRVNNVQPIGVPGELCVAGAGLAREYLNKPDKTAEKFVDCPFIEGERMYRTGDLVRWLATGDIDFLGRIDFQVKIRGFRIELSEIEGQLLKFPSIKEAIVIDRLDRDGNKYLAAYFVSTGDISLDELKKFLKQALPDYMVPAAFVPLPRMPLNSSGKVNRKALPEPVFEEGPKLDFVEPRDDKEKRVADVWKSVLGLSRVSVLDNFFELGGHSLKGIAVVARLQKEFKITINDIFEHQTIAELAKRITPVEDNLPARLEKIQERLVREIEQRKTAPPLTARFAPDFERYRTRGTEDGSLDVSVAEPYRNLLLTGATGYLGAFLLRALLENQDTHVTCIVRGKDDREAWNRLSSRAAYYFGDGFLEKLESRITVLCGELSRENLGLSQARYESLAGAVDAIVHSAALVKHYGKAAEFHDANVVSTERLIAFAQIGQKKDFHLISTVSTGWGRVPGVQETLFTEDDCDLGQEIQNLYVKTKFEAEKIALFARKSGVMTSIYRVGNLTFESKGGPLQENIDENAFFSRIKAYLDLGVVPSDGDDAEFSYIDDVARAVRELMTRPALRNRVFHVGNPVNYRLSQVLVAPELGLNVETMGAGPFIGYLVKNLDRKAMRPAIEAILLHSGWLDDTHERTKFHLIQERTDALLDRIGFGWSELPMHALRKMIVHALKERIALLASHPLIRSMKREDIESLACSSRKRVFQEGAHVIEEGKPANKLYLIGDGVAEENKVSMFGWVGTLRVLGPNSFVGLESLFPKKDYSIGVEAVLGDTTALEVDGSCVASAMRSNPELALAVLKLTVDRVNQLETLYVSA